jgi:OmcA/MtrC family decaheme c-type cytochrome
MRVSHSVFVAGRYALALGAVAGSVVLFSATRTPGAEGVPLGGRTAVNAERVPLTGRTPVVNHADPMLARKDLAARSVTASKDAALVNFVRPGLTIAIQNAKVTSDGTISVDYKLLDPKGQPLDLNGLITPGAISLSFIADYIPKGAKEFWAYTTRVSTSPNGKGSAVQAGAESISTGTTTTVALGEYLYTFKQKAVPTDPKAVSGATFDPTVTHRIGIYGSRNLTEFDLGTNNASTTYDFVPNGSAVTYTRDVIRTSSCNKCHDQLSAHGGSRQGLDLCIMCHQSQTINPGTGNSMDSVALFHKLHMGASLPSVKAGGTYGVIGRSVVDYSTVVFPANPGDPRNCQICHESNTGAAQANIWLTSPSIAACGSCHDNVNFATGANHVNLPQANDNACSQCHQPTGQYSFDTSITGAHVNPTQAPEAPGINLSIVSVANAGPGKAPFVTFTIKDNAGNAITMAQMTGGTNGLSLVMAGPTNDYGYTNFGVTTTPGYVSETVTGTAQCNSSGTCTYQFTHAIPANAKGSFAIGMQGRRALTINPGTLAQVITEYGAKNVVTYFSVDGTPVVPRRTVVSIANCNKCHGTLSLHGENRNQIEMCVLCHNPSEGDESTRPNATVASDKTAPVQGVNFAYMVHRIHTGENLTAQGASYTIVGYGGSHNDFTDVRYPVMGPTGSTGYTQSCYMCHVNGSESVLPITSMAAASATPASRGYNAVTNPSALVSPVGATTSACTGCHTQTDAMGHALQQTNSQFGESCAVCHGTGADFNATDIHKSN